MDELDALRLQLEWGADEFLLAPAQDRRVGHAQDSRVGHAQDSRVGHAQDRRVQTPLSPLLASSGAKPALRAVPAAPLTATLPALAEAARIAESCATLDELRAALDAFTGCALRDTATQLVFADGPPDARLMLIGEAPGAEEDRAGKPFIGPAGQLLDKMLASIGVERSKVRIINTVPWRPPGNRAPSEAEITACLPFLHRHIALVHPAILVLLGAIAAKAMLPAQSSHAGIRRLRGQWLQVAVPGLAQPLACLPSYHPAYLLRLPTAKRDSWHDMLALKQALNALN